MVRDAIAADHEAIQEIHRAMGMDYRLPDLNSPLLFVNKVKTDEQGRVVGACFLRITAETYLLLSPELGAKEKVIAMEELQPSVLAAAWEKGIDDIEARIPETVEQKFWKRLIRLGWRKNRSGWNPWTRATV